MKGIVWFRPKKFVTQKVFRKFSLLSFGILTKQWWYLNTKLQTDSFRVNILFIIHGLMQNKLNIKNTDISSLKVNFGALNFLTCNLATYSIGYKIVDLGVHHIIFSHNTIFNTFTCISRRSQWPRGLRRRSQAARLLRLCVRIPTGHSGPEYLKTWPKIDFMK